MLHKSQVMLVEKNESNESSAWRMDSVTDIRSDDNFYAKYMAGAYGAVPQLWSRAQSARWRETVVGEGDAEVLFMQHLKSLYVQRGSGVVVTIKNARGKGAAHVVDVN
ncbi:MAG: hypothetical protein V9G10_07610 [Candidatus Nanopelagicales bacterium]